MALDNVGLLRTSADDLFELVKDRKKISVEEAAKKLKLPQPTVQALVDFLVEEKIFGLEYKFTTPFVYLSKEEFDKKRPKFKEKTIRGINIISKDEFYQKAKQKGIFHESIDSLWRKYLNQNIHYIKDEFYGKAKLRNIPNEKVDMLWEKYESYLK